jgi:hypothetical protein
LNETELDAKFDELRQQLFDNQSLFYNGDILKSMQELEQTKQGLQAKDKELEQAKQGLQAKDKELEQTKQGLQAKDKELEQAKQGLQAKDKELVLLYTSKSWLLTRPIRKILRLFISEKN